MPDILNFGGSRNTSYLNTQYVERAWEKKAARLAQEAAGNRRER